MTKPTRAQQPTHTHLPYVAWKRSAARSSKYSEAHAEVPSAPSACASAAPRQPSPENSSPMGRYLCSSGRVDWQGS